MNLETEAADPRRRQGDPVLPKQNGKDVILTGGNKGLGYETVRQLTNLGVYVIIASHNEAEVLAAVKKICEEDSEAHDSS